MITGVQVPVGANGLTLVSWGDLLVLGLVVVCLSVLTVIGTYFCIHYLETHTLSLSSLHGSSRKRLHESLRELALLDVAAREARLDQLRARVEEDLQALHDYSAQMRAVRPSKGPKGSRSSAPPAPPRGVDWSPSWAGDSDPQLPSAQLPSAQLPSGQMQAQLWAQGQHSDEQRLRDLWNSRPRAMDERSRTQQERRLQQLRDDLAAATAPIPSQGPAMQAVGQAIQASQAVVGPMGQRAKVTLPVEHEGIDQHIDQQQTRPSLGPVRTFVPSSTAYATAIQETPYGRNNGRQGQIIRERQS